MTKIYIDPEGPLNVHITRHRRWERKTQVQLDPFHPRREKGSIHLRNHFCRHGLPYSNCKTSACASELARKLFPQPPSNYPACACGRSHGVQT